MEGKGSATPGVSILTLKNCIYYFVLSYLLTTVKDGCISDSFGVRTAALSGQSELRMEYKECESLLRMGRRGGTNTEPCPMVTSRCYFNPRHDDFSKPNHVVGLLDYGKNHNHDYLGQ